MTIKEARKHIENRFRNLHSFMIFHYDPIMKDIAVREGYFPSYGEGAMWAKDVCDYYNKYKIAYAYYCDGIMEEVHGDIETGKW